MINRWSVKLCVVWVRSNQLDAGQAETLAFKMIGYMM